MPTRDPRAEGSAIDREYSNRTNRYLSDRKEAVISLESDGETRARLNGYYDEMKKQAYVLAKPDPKMNPVDAAPLLAETADRMALNYEELVGLDAQGMADWNQTATASKRIFLDTYQKISGPEAIPTSPQRALATARSKFEAAAKSVPLLAMLAPLISSLEQCLQDPSAPVSSDQAIKMIGGTLHTILPHLHEASFHAYQELCDGAMDEAGYKKVQAGILSAAEGVRQLLYVEDFEKKQVAAEGAKQKTSQTAGIAREEDAAAMGSARGKLSQTSSSESVTARRFDFSQDARFNALKAATTVEQVRALVTPEMQQIVLSNFLHELDAMLVHAKGWAERNPGNGILERKSMANAFGAGISGSEGVRYQKFALAVTGKVFDLKEIGRMPINEFAGVVLGYDLKKDGVRASALEKYTNAFM